MKCPVDGTTLVMTDRSGIEIDYCPQCRGVWLDRGELDKIVERSAAAAAPMPPAPPAPPVPPAPHSRPVPLQEPGRSSGWAGDSDRDRRPRDDDWRDDGGRDRYRRDDDDDYRRGHKRKRKDSFLSELFDF